MTPLPATADSKSLAVIVPPVIQRNIPMKRLGQPEEMISAPARKKAPIALLILIIGYIVARLIAELLGEAVGVADVAARAPVSLELTVPIADGPTRRADDAPDTVGTTPEALHLKRRVLASLGDPLFEVFDPRGFERGGILAPDSLLLCFLGLLCLLRLLRLRGHRF